ncbi:HTTM domain-containing protein [Melghirimyces algeriensis]|uniref:Vitamin K-dependent gamma-carboxylase n=1 Tax=Melghirimyces algeriensis TaxID=910412 RepID=A0A521EA49_9BACL|nr:HTTM domain-containing protein [Melghirimyces algeriensis]SMO80818.1 Vitamin K-dependent gamma-carboxylase [Melghirimyces algeriensis]
MIQRFIEWSSKERLLIGASLIRVQFALILLTFFILNYGQRDLLWGPDGIWSYGNFLSSHNNGILNLFHFSASNLFFEILFHLFIVILVLYLLGIRTRLTGLLVFIFFWSFYYRNPAIMNGGMNLLRLELLYLMFANTGAYLALTPEKPVRDIMKKSLLEKMIAVLHNVAVMAVALQIILVYFTAGIYKVMGSYWQDGTAVYYALRLHEFYWPGVNDWIWNQTWLVVLASYGTILIQVMFPAFIVHPKLKYFALAGVVSMHIGIAFTMSLFFFSWIMIASEMILLNDEDYRKIKQWLRKLKELAIYFRDHKLVFRYEEEK